MADCAIASIAMATGLSYREVSEDARKVALDPHRTGLYTRQILKIARRLKRPLGRVALKGTLPSEDTAGLLVVKNRREYHAVMWFYGTIIDPAQGLVWLAEAYLASGRWTPWSFHPRQRA